MLNVDPRTGLSSAEAAKRQAQYGKNVLTQKRGASAVKRFLMQFAAPLMYILLIAGGVTAYFGEYIDAAVIIGVVIINAIVGFIQESKAEKAIEALSKLVITEATVRRDGEKRRLNSDELVPGDIVLLQAGDKVPADLRLLQVKSLQIDEAPLTGESAPVTKQSNALAAETILAERKNMAYAGTLVTYGVGEGVVWTTGNSTETGRIARLLDEAPDLTTPLTRKIEEFSRVILWAILGLAVVTFAVGLWRGQKPIEVFMAAVALAVGAIPEGLPAAITVTLALGVNRMARKRAIIRRLPAVETLGSASVICSDKTGTLTENEMTVQQIFAGGELFQVSGVGYQSIGTISFAGSFVEVRNKPALAETLLAGLLNNDSQVRREGERHKVDGDPTEAALIVAAQKGGFVHQEACSTHPRIDAIPFESELQYMATLHQRHAHSGRVIYKKGSLERLLDRCTHALDKDGQPTNVCRDEIIHAAERMASDGLRVLALARREAAADQQSLAHEHVSAGLTFLGLQGMIDPPREEAREAIAKCQNAGIEVKMITGDHLLTAKSIARQLGLGNGAGEIVAVNGATLEKSSDAELLQIADKASVFARVAPEHKLRLVRALQARGHVVAMTGDGVNDAPALKQADIGIAMGITGTDVAKGAADMLLTDDNFATIEAAVEEGRSVYDNLTKFIVWTLPTNMGEALVLVTAILLGTALPLLPVQALWINLSTAIFLGLMLVFEPKEEGLMRRPPRNPKAGILTFPLIMRTCFITLLMLCSAFGLFLWGLRSGMSDAEARTIVVNTIVMFEVFYLINCRSLLNAPWKIGFFSNPSLFLGIAGMIGVQLVFTHTALFNRLFHTVPITLRAWGLLTVTAFAAFLLVELEKWIRRKVGRGTE